MQLVVAGVSHKTAPVELREQLAIPTEALPDFLVELTGIDDIDEAMVVSTCNRVEIYAVPKGDPTDAIELLVGLLAAWQRVEAEDIRTYGYSVHGTQAIRHLLRVSASLDSMVVGEPQILGQVKDAAKLAKDIGTIGPVLDRLLQRTFKLSKIIRTTTGIGETRVSIGSVAVDLAKRIFDRLDKSKVLLVGAGKMGEVTARSLSSAGVARVYIANRSYARASRLAETHGWSARDLSELEDLLAQVDIVLTSTGSTHPIISPPLIKRVIKARKYRPLFLVDIAVPRDIDPEVADLDTIYLYNVDDLEEISRQNLQERVEQAEDAEAMVRAELMEIEAWLRTLEIEPTIRAIRERAMAIAEAEVEFTLKKRLKDLSGKEQKAVRKMMSAAISKLLHPTMTALKTAAAEGGSGRLLADARVLHGIGDEAERNRVDPSEARDRRKSGPAGGGDERPEEGDDAVTQLEAKVVS